jgi:hypothetical protein
MPLTPDQILAAALAPKSVTVDGNSATAPDAATLIALANFAAGQNAVAARVPSMRTFKLIPPGSVAGCSGYRGPCC